MRKRLEGFVSQRLSTVMVNQVYVNCAQPVQSWMRNTCYSFASARKCEDWRGTVRQLASHARSFLLTGQFCSAPAFYSGLSTPFACYCSVDCSHCPRLSITNAVHVEAKGQTSTSPPASCSLPFHLNTKPQNIRPHENIHCHRSSFVDISTA